MRYNALRPKKSLSNSRKISLYDEIMDIKGILLIILHVDELLSPLGAIFMFYLII